VHQLQRWQVLRVYGSCSRKQLLELSKWLNEHHWQCHRYSL
jgi:hypothetical protein